MSKMNERAIDNLNHRQELFAESLESINDAVGILADLIGYSFDDYEAIEKEEALPRDYLEEAFNILKKLPKSFERDCLLDDLTAYQLEEDEETEEAKAFRLYMQSHEL